jgi:hypothetical protein
VRISNKILQTCAVHRKKSSEIFVGTKHLGLEEEGLRVTLVDFDLLLAITYNDCIYFSYLEQIYKQGFLKKILVVCGSIIRYY